MVLWVPGLTLLLARVIKFCKYSILLFVSYKKISEVELEVRGISCAGCINKITNQLLKLPGVQSADISLVTHKAQIQYDHSLVTVDQILRAIRETGYSAKPAQESGHHHHQEAAKDLKKLGLKAAVAALLSVIIIVIDHNKGSSLSSLRTDLGLEAGLTMIVLLWCGKDIYKDAFDALKAKRTNMNVLVTIGTLVTFAYSYILASPPLRRGSSLRPSILETYGVNAHPYYETAAMIMTIVLLGRYLEAKAKERATNAIHTLFQLQPKTASLIESGNETQVDIAKVQMGDLLRIRPGESVPVDGVITDGASEVNESMLTGESRLIHKATGDRVYAGTINESGSVIIESKAIGEMTALARIIKLVEKAQSSRAPIQRLADKIASIFVPAILVITVLVFFIWASLYPLSALPQAVQAAVSVLIISCPCALGLATPIAVIVGCGRGAERGILFRDAQAIEIASKIQTIVFDKTGTLTLAKPQLTRIEAKNRMSEQQLLQIAASVEQGSEHSIAQAIFKAADPEHLLNVRDFQSIKGKGIRAYIADQEILLGSPAWVQGKIGKVDWSNQETHTPIFLAIEGQLAAIFYITDGIKENAKETLARIQSAGVEVCMLTGDHESTAREVATTLGIEHYQAEVLPETKVSFIQNLRKQGKMVAMVGDGVNDAPALATADLGIAMGSGTDIAMESAQVTLLNSDLNSILETIDLSRKTLRVIKQNLFLAFVYNVVAIPIAAFGLLNPVIAAAAMGLSSISVVLNAVRLRYIA
jgi:Cu+-exporting ATPase